ncbi:SPOR domain-containing protein [candidate division KSB1 bacterium]|nr:SPOR domain-containing protein [candidate division KSB1 bacterium]
MRHYVIIILLLFIGGCATTQKVTKEEAESDAKMSAIDESFNPAVLEDDEITINRKETEESSSNFDMSALDISDETEKPDKNVPGYRVQICAVADEMKAREIQQDAILKFLENVYLTFDSPYYKVRVGDCITRFEADMLQHSAIEKGFEDAWVVKTTVRSQPKSRIDDVLK